MSNEQCITAQQFRQVVGNFATGVTIVTTRDPEGKPYGLTVNSFTSVSLEPVLVLVCLDNRLGGIDFFRKKKTFGINILAEDQQDISTHFATKNTQRAEHLTRVGRTGVPLVNEALASIECEVVESYPGGDHTILLGQVKCAELSPACETRKPLLFFRGKYRHLHC